MSFQNGSADYNFGHFASIYHLGKTALYSALQCLSFQAGVTEILERGIGQHLSIIKLFGIYGQSWMQKCEFLIKLNK